MGNNQSQQAPNEPQPSPQIKTFKRPSSRRGNLFWFPPTPPQSPTDQQPPVGWYPHNRPRSPTPPPSSAVSWHIPPPDIGTPPVVLDSSGIHSPPQPVGH